MYQSGGSFSLQRDGNVAQCRANAFRFAPAADKQNFGFSSCSRQQDAKNTKFMTMPELTKLMYYDIIRHNQRLEKFSGGRTE